MDKLYVLVHRANEKVVVGVGRRMIDQYSLNLNDYDLTQSYQVESDDKHMQWDLLDRYLHFLLEKYGHNTNRIDGFSEYFDFQSLDELLNVIKQVSKQRAKPLSISQGVANDDPWVIKQEELEAGRRKEQAAIYREKRKISRMQQVLHLCRHAVISYTNDNNYWYLAVERNHAKADKIEDFIGRLFSINLPNRQEIVADAPYSTERTTVYPINVRVFRNEEFSLLNPELEGLKQTLSTIANSVEENRFAKLQFDSVRDSLFRLTGIN